MGHFLLRTGTSPHGSVLRLCSTVSILACVDLVRLARGMDGAPGASLPSLTEARGAGQRQVPNMTQKGREVSYVPDHHFVSLVIQVRAEIITTYALCGFANLSSIGIMLGGLCELTAQ